MKKQKNLVKDTVSTGIASMAGLSAIGTIGKTPGMPANNITGITSAGLGLANVGQLTKTSMSILPTGKKMKSKKMKW